MTGCVLSRGSSRFDRSEPPQNRPKSARDQDRGGAIWTAAPGVGGPDHLCGGLGRPPAQVGHAPDLGRRTDPNRAASDLNQRLRRKPRAAAPNHQSGPDRCSGGLSRAGRLRSVLRRSKPPRWLRSVLGRFEPRGAAQIDARAV